MRLMSEQMSSTQSKMSIRVTSFLRGKKADTSNCLRTQYITRPESFQQKNLDAGRVFKYTCREV